MSKLKILFASIFAFVLFVGGAGVANADGLDLSSVTVNTTPVFTLAGIIVAAIASIWAIKKVIKLGNHS